MKQNGIDHVRSAPFHPSSNGLAERAVQTFKEGMKKVKGETVQTRLSRFLFSYRITPHATTGLSPAELMMSRRLRSASDLLMPDVKTKVQQKQQKQKENHDTKKRLRRFAPGDKVFIRNYSFGPKWIPASLASSSGPMSHTVTIGSRQTMKQHVDQVRARLQDTVPSEPDTELELLSDTEANSEDCVPVKETPPPPELQKPQSAPDLQTKPESPVARVVRRSQRERCPPVRLKDFAR